MPASPTPAVWWYGWRLLLRQTRATNHSSTTGSGLRCCHGNASSSNSSGKDAQLLVKRPAAKEELRLVCRENLTWHPGHIHKGRARINQRLTTVDAFVEVHDARIPLTGRARLFEDSRAARPHVLVLNKADLVPPSARAAWRRHMEEREGAKVIHCILRGQAEQGRILTEIMACVVGLAADSRPDKQEFSMMVAGLPNVGKSSLINGLRGHHTGKSSAARVGRLAGVTRTVGERILVCQDPPVFVLDSPGILDPEFKDDIETMLKLGACGCVNLDSVDTEAIAAYVLHCCNSRGDLSYVALYDLDGPVSTVEDLLAGVCRKHRLVQAQRNFITGRVLHGPNLPAGAQLVLRNFGQGLLGRFVLDRLPTDPPGPPLPFAYAGQPSRRQRSK